MHFAIIQDADRSDNRPFAAQGNSQEEVAQKICQQMHGAYEMPQEITTLEAADMWFSGNTEDAEPAYPAANPYNAVWHWNTEKM